MSIYTKRLDKSKDYGTYHPPMGRARFTQGGYDFDHEGYIVDENLDADQRAELNAKFVKKAQAQRPAASPEKKGDEKDKSEPGEEKDASDDGLNLELWLRGEEEYPFPDVQKAVKARYSVWKTAKRDLVMFLVDDQKLVLAEELSDELKSVMA